MILVLNFIPASSSGIFISTASWIPDPDVPRLEHAFFAWRNHKGASQRELAPVV
jgi:hypothetical protein